MFQLKALAEVIRQQKNFNLANMYWHNSLYSGDTIVLMVSFNLLYTLHRQYV